MAMAYTMEDVTKLLGYLQRQIEAGAHDGEENQAEMKRAWDSLCDCCGHLGIAAPNDDCSATYYLTDDNDTMLYRVVDWTHQEIWPGMRFTAVEEAWNHIREKYAPDEPYSEDKFADLLVMPVVNGEIDEN